jgi:hypothetical protein
MSRKEVIFLSSFVLVFAAGFIFYMKKIYKPKTVHTTSQPAASQTASPTVAIESPPSPGYQTWTLPDVLKEISGNVLAGQDRMACIEDNEGIIYIYNLQSKKIDEEIKFAGKGDYEGIARVGDVYWVLRSDGFLYEVHPVQGGKSTVKTYDLPLTSENDTESLFYDSENKRLLVGVKEKDLTEKDKKGVYAFDLDKKTLNKEAVFYIDGGKKDKEEADKGKKKKKKKKEVKPSDLAIHPKTRDIYVLDGPESELLILEPSGKLKSTQKLDKDVFPQPEGLCFSEDGHLYISSEAGKKGKAVIAKMELQ